ncbi:hypothetical protein [Arenibacter echinorum]|uniref:hypothetical protein n=1 Tax=Arenibacter echinorum TaxID=440515 RepID=UPI000DBA0B94|nr:hypothetical protein [Arenibacter echinorum]
MSLKKEIWGVIPQLGRNCSMWKCTNDGIGKSQKAKAKSDEEREERREKRKKRREERAMG